MRSPRKSRAAAITLSTGVGIANLGRCACPIGPVGADWQGTGKRIGIGTAPVDGAWHLISASFAADGEDGLRSERPVRLGASHERLAVPYPSRPLKTGRDGACRGSAKCIHR